MRTEDFFEALTDIDDKMIANAKPEKDAPEIVRLSEKRRSPWKPIASAAACLAILGTAGAVIGLNFSESDPLVPESSAYLPDNYQAIGELEERHEELQRISDERSGAAPLKPVKISDERSKDVKTLEFEMEEFPGSGFRYNGNSVVARPNGGSERMLFHGNNNLFNVYLADLNGDGLREIVSEADCGNEFSDRDIYAYDLKNGLLYELSDIMRYKYSLVLQNDTLYIRTTRVYTADGSHYTEFVPLTLDMMTQSGGDLTTLDLTQPIVNLNKKATFTLEEFPGYVFMAEERKFTVIGEEDGGRYAEDISMSYLADLDGDGKREICLTLTSPDHSGNKIMILFASDNGNLCGSLIESAGGSCWLLKDYYDYENLCIIERDRSTPLTSPVPAETETLTVKTEELEIGA